MSIEKRLILKQDIMAYMSQEGYDKLVADLQYLESVERPKASAAIAEAADKGDLSENSEYDAAKEAQRHLEVRIAEMKMTVAQAKIVDVSRLSTDAVQIMSTVEMKNVTTNSSRLFSNRGSGRPNACISRYIVGIPE